MPHIVCYPLSDPNASFNYCPSYGAAILFAALFGATFMAHIGQAFFYKKPFATVVIMGAGWEFAGYIFRILSVENQHGTLVATCQQLLILLAPLWINAFIYMLLGRMIHFYLADDRVLRIRARRITLIFVLFDILAFCVQVTGGMMVTPSSPPASQENGLHIYEGGIGLQLVFIAIFIAIAVRFQQQLKLQEHKSLEDGEGISYNEMNSPVQARRLLYIIYVVIGLIILRNIYRLAEFSSGVISSITTHEWYTYVFDAVPMFFALVVFNIWHPGRFLHGPRCDFTEENKARKAAKKEKKMAKGAEKDERKRVQLLDRAAKQEEKRERKGQPKRGSYIPLIGVQDTEYGVQRLSAPVATNYDFYRSHSPSLEE